MAWDNNIFTYFIVPSGFDKATKKQKFSICFELNNRHTVFTPPPGADWAKVLQEWKQNVQNFPKIISDMRGKNWNLAIEQGANLVQVPATFVPPELNVELSTVSCFWNHFLGYSIITGDGYTDLAKPGGNNLYIAPIYKPDMSGGVHYHAAAPTPFDVLGENLVMADPQKISVSQIFQQLEKAGLSKDGVSRQAMYEGIIRASKIVRQKNANRNELIKNHKNNSAAFTSAFQSFAAHGRQYSNTLSTTQAKDQFDEWSERFSEFQALMYVTSNEPPYIQEAVNKLNSYDPLRRMTGTTIEFTIEWTAALEKQFTTECILSADLSTAVGIPDYFIGQKTAAKSCSFDARLILAAPNKNHSDAILQVGENCRMISYEPENVAQNYQSVVKKSERFSQEAKDMIVPLSFVQDKKYELLNFAKGGKLSLHVAFEGHRSLQSSLQEFRAVNNQITNTQTKGLSVFVNTPLEPPLKRADNALDEQDLISGYAIYARKPGEKRWQSLTSCEELFSYPDQPSAHQTFHTTEIGLPISLLTLSTDVPASGAGASVPGADGYYGIASGLIFYWDGTKISSRNPMTLQEADTAADEKPQPGVVEEWDDKRNDTATEYFLLQKGTRKLFGEDWFPFKTYDKPPAGRFTCALTASDRDKNYPPLFRIQRTYRFSRKGGTENDQIRLKFGEAYEFLLTAQYHNGFIPMAGAIERFNQNPQDASLRVFANLSEACKTRPALGKQSKFLRHDHIRDLIISLGDDIYQKDNDQVVLPQYFGETVFDLVIRSDGNPTSKTCNRYILPPPVPSFYNYLWYERRKASADGTLRVTDLTGDELEKWYKKYQCRTQPGKPCPKGCETYCNGTIQSRLYNHELNYLPDPIVTGFAIRFYLDPERKIRADRFADEFIEYPETFCAYSKRNYPQVAPWLLILQNDVQEEKEKNKVKVNYRRKEIRVSVRQGFSIYAEIIPTYEQSECQFHPQLPFNKEHFSGNSEDGKLYYNTLYSNCTPVSFTHASKKPLFEPQIKQMDICRFQKTEIGKKENNFKAIISLHFEHLNIWRGVPIQGILPTGALELYAQWDEYGNNRRAPVKDRKDKADRSKPGGGFIKIADIKFSTDPVVGQQPSPVPGIPAGTDPLRAYMATVQFFSDAHFPIPYFTDVTFKIREVSKFPSYFPDGKVELTEESKEAFSSWSNEVALPSQQKMEEINITSTSLDEADQHVTTAASASNFLFNNNKPALPEIERILPLVVQDTKDEQLTVKGNRFRVYLKNNGRNGSGKNERIGIIVSPLSTDRPGLYNDLFTKHELFSRCGYDVVADNPANVISSMLIRDHFVVQKGIMEEDYIMNFDPQYEPVYYSGSNPIGLMTFWPMHDPEQDLWYVDIELNVKNNQGKPLHTVFVQLNMVHYQPYSSHYWTTAQGDQDLYDKDYRISAPVRADFVAIYSERRYTNPAVLFKKTGGKKFDFSVAINSLFLKTGKLCTQFFVHVEKKGSNNMWHEVPAAFKNYVANNAPVTVATRQRTGDLPILPLDDYSNRQSQDISVSFDLDFEQTWLGTYRLVFIEIEYHHESSGLADLQMMLETTPHDLAQLPGVKVIGVTIIDK